MANLILMAGKPASGKTTIAHAIGNFLNCPVLEKDIISSELIKYLPISESNSLISYDILFSLAYDILIKQRLSLVIDSTCHRPLVLEKANHLIRESNITMNVIYCFCSDEITYQRLATRTKRTSQAGAEALSFIYNFNHIPYEALKIDTEKPLEKNIIKIQSHLIYASDKQ